MSWGKDVGGTIKLHAKGTRDPSLVSDFFSRRETTVESTVAKKSITCHWLRVLTLTNLDTLECYLSLV